MKGYEFIKAIQEKKIDSNAKFKVTNIDKTLDAIVRFDGVDIVYYENNENIFNYWFLTTILNADFEVIEENKEIEEKLDWEEITGSVGKPVWDNKRKKWRVLDYYCRERDIFYVSFSDTSNREKFGEKELYFKERE